MLGVCLVTYNQENYIAQAIESVLNQQACGEQVIIYIGEDCSTDMTGAICDQFARAYPENVLVLHRQCNMGLVNNTLDLLDRIRKDGGKYIAMLDGDDYWSDPQKLKKQLDFFHTHKDCGLIHTATDFLTSNGIQRDTRSSIQYGNVFNQIESYRISNCSVIFKSELLDMLNFQELSNQQFRSIDYVMYAIFSSKVPFAFLPEHTAVWRLGHASVSHPIGIEKQLDYINHELKCWHYLSEQFPDRWTYRNEDVQNYYHTRYFTLAFKLGDRRLALREAKLITSASFHIKLKIFFAHSRFLMALWLFSRQRFKGIV